jgi:hypothetical protein
MVMFLAAGNGSLVTSVMHAQFAALYDYYVPKTSFTVRHHHIHSDVQLCVIIRKLILFPTYSCDGNTVAIPGILLNTQ